MKLYESKFLYLDFFPEKQLILMVWQTATQDMEDYDYKSENLAGLKYFMQYQPKNIVVDTQEMLFPISPEMQVWVNENVFAHILAVGIEKMALVISHEFITQLSIEQTMNETQGNLLSNRYFRSLEDALDWIYDN